MSVSLFCKCIIFVSLVPALMLVSFPGWPDIYAMRRFVQMAVLVVLTLSLFWNNTFFRQYRRELLVLLMLLMLALLSSHLHSTSDHYVADLFFIPFYLLAILIKRQPQVRSRTHTHAHAHTRTHTHTHAHSSRSSCSLPC